MRQLPIKAVFQDGSTPSDGSPPLAPFVQQVQVQQDSDLTLAITAVASSGAAFDLTGYSLYFAARARSQQETPDLLVAGSLIAPTSGTASVVISNAQLATLTARAYGYVIAFKDGSNNIWPAVPEGLFAITPTDYYASDV